jgi:hypothetical protein
MKKQTLGNGRCQICRHEDRWRIELLHASGASFTSLAAKFGVDRDAIWRHWHQHVTAEMKAGYLAGPVQLQDLAAKAADTGGSVLDHLHAVRTVLMGHLANATEAADGRAAAYIAGRLTATLETIARISGELGDLARSTTYNITNVAVLQENPAFIRMQATLLKALAPFPDARNAVVVALRDLDSKSSPAATPGPAKPDMKLIEGAAVHV